jgi:hypothetical protein
MSTRTDSLTDWVEEDLALDLRAYGSCYWKMVDGRKVRVHPRDIRYINDEPRDSSNTVCSSAKFSTTDKPTVGK